MTLFDGRRWVVRVGVPAGLLLVPVLFEVLMLTPLPSMFYLVYGPLSLLLLFVLVKKASLSAGILCLSLFVLWAVPWSPRKPFVRDLARIEIGMQHSEVADIMAPYRETAAADSLQVTYQLVEPSVRFDSEFGVIRYDARGRVAEVMYLPD